MLYLIGIGLNNEKDITVNGLESVNKCDLVYLENYTSRLSCSVKDLERFYKKSIIVSDRDQIENKAYEIINNAKTKDVAVLIIGDVFGATTHISLMMDAKKEKVKVKIIHNSSILTAIGVTGLELYKFGRITSIPFDNKDVKAPVDVFNNNFKNDLHTLFLLDLDLKEDRFMTVNDAAGYLIKNKINPAILAVGCAGLGSDNPEIKSARLKQLKTKKFTQFPQCLIIPSKKLHFVEEEALGIWK